MKHEKQDRHHNGVQAARRLHILCSFGIHSFGALVKAVGLFMHHFTAAISKGDFLTPRFGGLGGTWGSR